MINVELKQNLGQIFMGNISVGCDFSYENFENLFLGESNRIYGKNGDGKYCLKNTVTFFGEEFKICFKFKNKENFGIDLYLLSGPVARRCNEYVNIQDSQVEFDYIADILKGKLTGLVEYRRNLFLVWEYNWGEISLMYQMQDLSVYININWTSARAGPCTSINAR